MNPSTQSGFGWAGDIHTPDHDQPYRFGRRPNASAPYPFSTRQYARLLVLRGRVQDGAFHGEDTAEQAA